MSRIAQAIVAMTGRVTMLGLSRWAGRGGSYRSVQRFFNTVISWPEVFLRFFLSHLHRPGGEYFLVGDESVVTKAGRETHGLDHFFSSLHHRVVKGIAIFSVSIVSVDERRAYPLQTEQIIRTEAEKTAAKRHQERRVKTDQNARKKPGRPKGSRNRDKTDVVLTPELTRIQRTIQKQLKLLSGKVKIRHLALDGHFGNNKAVQMVLQCGLHLISKLRHDAALYFKYQGEQNRFGPRRKYGQKIDYRRIPQAYLVSKSIQGQQETCVYQAQMLHRAFAQPLNVVIITKTDLKTGTCAHVILFSTDLALAAEKIIDYYSLRFQIEFNFRDAKQYWGLEDFMSVKPVPVTNAINLALFMVNLSQVLLHQYRQSHPGQVELSAQRFPAPAGSGVLDLKAYFRAAKYFEEMIKMLPKKPDPILLEQVFGQISSLGCIHAVNVQTSPP
jgi:hypothetical protein